MIDPNSLYMRVVVQPYLKNLPEEYRGQTSGTWTFNSKDVVDNNRIAPWHYLAVGVVKVLLEMWIKTNPDLDEVNQQITEVAEAIAGLRVERVEET